MKIKSKYKDRFLDICLGLAIIFQDAGDFDFFPVNLYNIFIFIMFLYYFVKILIIKKVPKISQNIIFLLCYILILTFIHKFNLSTVKNIFFLLIEFFTFYMYISQLKDFSRIYKVIYICAFILSFYGIIQLIAYKLELPYIYDITIYHFGRNADYLLSGRPTSLYAEPAHLCGVLSAALYIAITKKSLTNNSYIKNYRTIIIFVFSILTKTLLVYISMIIFFIYYLYAYKKVQINKKIVIVIFVSILCLIFVMNNQNFIEISYDKILYLIEPSTSDIAGTSRIGTCIKFKCGCRKNEGWIYPWHRIIFS